MIDSLPETDFDPFVNGHLLIAPEDAELEKEAEERAKRIIGRWKLRTLADAYQERPPQAFLVEGLLPCPSLDIVYGGPGSLKSMLLADLAVCVASGERWLEPLPGTSGTGLVTLRTEQAPVLLVDFDNGTRRTDERIDAFARARHLPIDAPLHYVSMPQPWLDASSNEMVQQLAELVTHLGARLIIIDNLGLITGDTEENSGEMAQVMGNLRWLCEETVSAVIVVHHQRKSSGANDKGVRKGEMLRGHSSIEASLDLALMIERKEGEDKIAIVPTKVRGYREHDIIGANFTYEHKEGTKELVTARFFANEVMTVEEREIMSIESSIKSVLRQHGQMTQSELVTGVRDTMAAEPGGKAPGINKLRGTIKRLAEEGQLIEHGKGTKCSYRVP